MTTGASLVDIELLRRERILAILRGRSAERSPQWSRWALTDGGVSRRTVRPYAG